MMTNRYTDVTARIVKSARITQSYGRAVPRMVQPAAMTRQPSGESGQKHGIRVEHHPGPLPSDLHAHHLTRRCPALLQDPLGACPTPILRDGFRDVSGEQSARPRPVSAGHRSGEGRCRVQYVGRLRRRAPSNDQAHTCGGEQGHGGHGCTLDTATDGAREARQRAGLRWVVIARLLRQKAMRDDPVDSMRQATDASEGALEPDPHPATRPVA